MRYAKLFFLVIFPLVFFAPLEAQVTITEASIVELLDANDLYLNSIVRVDPWWRWRQGHRREQAYQSVRADTTTQKSADDSQGRLWRVEITSLAVKSGNNQDSLYRVTVGARVDKKDEWGKLIETSTRVMEADSNQIWPNTATVDSLIYIYLFPADSLEIGDWFELHLLRKNFIKFRPNGIQLMEIDSLSN